MIIINPIPGQEEENAAFLEDNGIGIWLKKGSNVDKILNDLFSHLDKLEEMKLNTKKLAKPQSTQDICKILLGNKLT